ncbi:MAG: class I SAM-dependent methyltransferase, partial [Nocardioidaceae bacterium]
GYDRSFGFVAAYGEALIELLDPRQGERVLDLGCGTGGLTAAIADRGAGVLGLDADQNMIATARDQHPGLAFRLGDGHAFGVDGPYDAVFSNAALHWMRDQDAAVARVSEALRPGGRFVAEMGAAGNVATITDAVRQARAELGLGETVLPWCFPTPAEQAVRLERAGFEVRLLRCFDRPTPLTECPEGVTDWLRMFGAPLLDGVPAGHRRGVLRRVDELTHPALVRDGVCVADYRRLRFAAVRR